MSPTRARNQRALIAVVQVAALSCWFSASAVAPAMQRDLDLGATGAVLLTSSVQVGFVVGACWPGGRAPSTFCVCTVPFLSVHWGG